MASPAPEQAAGQVTQQYRELVQDSQRLAQKISELETDRNEHKLVEETLTPLDPSRKAYRLVGEVLVERTVQEVLPSVQANRANLDQTITTLRERMEGKQKEAAELKTKHNINTDPPPRQ